MNATAPSHPPWHASGLLFENCSCQAICPGHVHFDQLCTQARCIGYWAMRFDDGAFGSLSLAGVQAVVAYDAPQHMIDGNWIETILIDAAASAAQREAAETILTGRAGGPWSVLARFVGRRVPTRTVPIRIHETGRGFAVAIAGMMQASVETIRGRDRRRPVTFENMFNQIHAPRQVIGKGTTRYEDGTITVANESTHGLWSRFAWAVDTAPGGP